ncbi:MAG TPA: MATE family efflux transporter [Bryobacteraceae bacterium]|nr:MATE family efflux transporter [Bryobacteraceae bacterium]
MTPQPQRAGNRIWRDLHDAILGTHRDFTEGAIGRAVFLLAVPMILEMAMESLFGIVDVFFVARLGTDSVATVALTEGMLTIVFGLALGLSMATTAMVARRTGEKDPRGAAVAAVHSIGIGVCISVVVGLAGAFNASRLLTLMGATVGIVQTGSTYTTIVLGAVGIIFMLFLINGIFRGAGDAAIAMRVLWLANMINIVLDPCLINGWGPFPRLGVTGAAVATATGRGIGVLYQLYMLLGGRGRIVIHRSEWKLDTGVLMRLVRVASSGTMQFLVSTASWLGMVRITALFGAAALAGYTIAIRVVIFALLPSWGMSNAAATLVGQNLGAGKSARAERSVWMTGFYNMLFLGAVAIVFIALAEPLIGIFTTDPDVLRFGTNCLRIVSYGYVFYAYGMVMVQAFNGAGDTVTPTLINLFCYWLWQIPLAYGLSRLAGLGPKGIFAAIAISESTLAVVSIVVFRRGKWKGQKI